MGSIVVEHYNAVPNINIYSGWIRISWKLFDERYFGVVIQNAFTSSPFLSPTELFLVQLCDLYNKDYIFDKFECAINKDASTVVTGTYGNKCNLYDRNGQSMKPLEVSISVTPYVLVDARSAFQLVNSALCTLDSVLKACDGHKHFISTEWSANRAMLFNKLFLFRRLCL